MTAVPPGDVMYFAAQDDVFQPLKGNDGRAAGVRKDPTNLVPEFQPLKEGWT